MVAINVIFVPRIGYWACAWGGFAGYGVPMLISYFLGQKKYPIPYDLKTIGKFVLLAGAMYAAHALYLHTLPVWLQLGAGTVLLVAFALAAWREIKSSKAI